MQKDKNLQSTKQLLAELNYPKQPNYLLAAMQDIHREFGAFDADTVRLLREHFHADETLWESLISLFPTKVSTPHMLKVCRGAVCDSQLDVSTLERGDVTIEEIYCTGNCHHAPVAILDDRLITEATPQQIRTLLSQQSAH